MITDIFTVYVSGLAFGAVIALGVYGLKYVIHLFRSITTT